MPRVGIEPTTQVFNKRAKMVHALDRADIVIGMSKFTSV
jgi:hypothetical protein